MKSSKVYIDITDFLTWSGHFTGIQRTLYSIIKELEKNRANFQLIVFAEGKYQSLVQDIESITRFGVKVRKQRRKLTKEEQLRRRLRMFYENMPPYVRVPSTPLMLLSKYGLNQFMPIGHSALHRVRLARAVFSQREVKLSIPQENKKRNSYGSTVIINQEDSLLVLSCIWDNYEHLGYLTDIVATKKPTFHCLVYDLIPIYASYAFGDGLADIYARYIFEILTLAKTVFPISEATADDLRKFMNDTGIVSDVVIKTLRLGDTIPATITSELDSIMKARYSKPFAISVGTIEARKNHVQLYAALKLAVQEKQIDQLPHIYIIGRAGWLADEVARFLTLDPELHKRVTILSDVADAELAWFYQNAQFSIYISQYEGWGLPVAESFVYGTPCIVSDVSSMREIAPKLSKFVSPFDSRQLIDAMLEYSDPRVCRLERDKITKYYKQTPWSDTVKPILDSLN